jgi:hypothetical protein
MVHSGRVLRVLLLHFHLLDLPPTGTSVRKAFITPKVPDEHLAAIWRYIHDVHNFSSDAAKLTDAAAIDRVIAMYKRLGKKIDKKFHDTLIKEYKMSNVHVYDPNKHVWLSKTAKQAIFSDPIAAMKMESDYRLEEAKRAAEQGVQAPVIKQHGHEMDEDELGDNDEATDADEEPAMASDDSAKAPAKNTRHGKRKNAAVEKKKAPAKKKKVIIEQPDNNIDIDQEVPAIDNAGGGGGAVPDVPPQPVVISDAEKKDVVIDDDDVVSAAEPASESGEKDSDMNEDNDKSADLRFEKSVAIGQSHIAFCEKAHVYMKRRMDELAVKILDENARSIFVKKFTRAFEQHRKKCAKIRTSAKDAADYKKRMMLSHNDFDRNHISLSFNP